MPGSHGNRDHPPDDDVFYLFLRKQKIPGAYPVDVTVVMYFERLHISRYRGYIFNLRHFMEDNQM